MCLPERDSAQTIPRSRDEASFVLGVLASLLFTGWEKWVVNQLKDIQARLENERNRLKELKVKLSEGALEERESSYGKRDEAATEYSELEKQFASLQRTREQLAEVEHALGKLGKGSYGLCDFCGKPIPSDRLEAVPQANLCVERKARQPKTGERKGSEKGAP